MAILITGGAGFIGSAIAKQLIDSGEEVISLDDGSRGRQCVKGVRYVIGDVRRIVDFRSPPLLLGEPISEVIHAAAINGTKNFYEIPDQVLDVGVRGILNVVEFCHLANVRRITFLSSSEVCRYKLVGPDEKIPLVIPDPHNPRYSYSASKIISEMVLLHSQHFDRTIILRPFNIFGPGMAEGHVIPDVMAQLERGETTIKLIGSGEESRSFCYVDDFVDGLMIARERGEHRGIYNVGRESEISIINLVKLMGQVFNIDPTIVTGLGLREGDVARRSPDISKLRALGYNPKISLLEGLKKCALSRAAKSATAAA